MTFDGLHRVNAKPTEPDAGIMFVDAFECHLVNGDLVFTDEGERLVCAVACGSWACVVDAAQSALPPEKVKP